MADQSLPLVIAARHEVWPLREAFKISRGSKTAADVITVAITDGHHTGHGEAVPYARFGESIASALTDIGKLGAVRDHAHFASCKLEGAARNAVDCAFWDYEAKRTGIRAAARAGCPQMRPVLTAYTLSLDTPEAMAAKARNVAGLPLLKLKLGGDGDAARMQAVRTARPDARLIADANEAWTPAMLPDLMALAARLGFETIEQPLPETGDEALRGTRWPVPVCADESIRTAADLPRLIGLYDAINIKLDKAGGLTGALALHRAARAADMKIMVGSMVATSLAVAPAMILAQDAEWTDLDGPLLLAADRPGGLAITSGLMLPPEAALWG